MSAPSRVRSRPDWWVKMTPDWSNRQVLPPVSEYNTWLEDAFNPQGKSNWTGARLRTAVRLRLNCESYAEIARVVGFRSSHGVKQALERLPLSLFPKKED